MDHKKFSVLYRIYYFGLINFTVFISLVMAVLRPFGMSTFTWNGQPVAGWLGYVGPFIASVVFSLLFSLVLAFFAWLGYKLFFRNH